MQNFTKNAQFECKGIWHLSTALLSSLLFFHNTFCVKIHNYTHVYYTHVYNLFFFNDCLKKQTSILLFDFMSIISNYCSPPTLPARQVKVIVFVFVLSKNYFGFRSLRFRFRWNSFRFGFRFRPQLAKGGRRVEEEWERPYTETCAMCDASQLRVFLCRNDVAKVIQGQNGIAKNKQISPKKWLLFIF